MCATPSTGRMTEGDSRPPPAARLRAVFNSVSVQLFLWLLAVMLAAFAIYAYVNIRTTSEQWTQSLYQAVNNTSELIKRATHYGMLLNRKEDVHQIIRMVAKGTGVVAVRVYDKSGTIIFSAAPEEIGRRVNMQAEACVICHDRAQPLEAVPAENRVRVYRDPLGRKLLGLINPIRNEPQCASASCHAHPPNRTILGVLDVTMSMAYADQRLALTKRQMIAAAFLTALITGAASALFIYRVVRVPVKRLIRGTRRIAEGDLDSRIELRVQNEIGQLAEAFNTMTANLSKARKELNEWSQRLEEKVVAKTEELARAERQIVHMEKMASLGKLAATVAHELNNPLSGILTYAKLVDRDLGQSALEPQRKEELGRYLGLIQKESSRCGDVVRNLLLFARPTGGDFALQHLNQIVERSLMLIRHHLEIASIQLDFHPLAGDDQIVCDANQLQQALVALLVNAVEAMSGGGVLTVAGKCFPSSVEIEISDTGVGIPEEIMPRVFEPFFSTKEDQNGVGLGLAVVYGIVQRHGGSIDVRSQVGRGTTFRIWLPKKPQDARASERETHQTVRLADGQERGGSSI